ncbi:hypothetical protein EJ06DRAFT_542327 [Trichodelitschia bisporula]|uniref:DASH complex subunit ASK1 n=1 Tax=Trichodelitschia bisporula TaxID=703511 RepID=A0A6G1I095_9PEZI|nr:hypothetical protein EJ06DRAFT_542327 [Trichodelitschia bisporula]
MAPPSTTARTLTLPEELEKLEQSITLTLQEIDHNFSRAHRIVTTSILPVVEQYAKHSEAVWSGSKFWKQFFEASANVSLSGYEEAAVDDTATSHDDTAGEAYDPTALSNTLSSPAKEPTTTALFRDHDAEHSSAVNDLADTLLSSPPPDTHSTPRMPPRKNLLSHHHQAPSFAAYGSPYESLRSELTGAPPPKPEPSTPGAPGLPDMSMSSPLPTPSGIASASALKNRDTILHQGILSKTYRVAATPHTARKTLGRAPAAVATPGTANRTKSRWDDETLSSSPEESAPRLRAEIFSSPVRAPRTPGVSVQTPGRGRWGTGAKAETATAGYTRTRLWESDDEDEDEDGLLGMSPPRTIAFELPEARVLRTPAPEASRRIVEDLLLTAGGDISEFGEEDSPSLVQRNRDLDATF